ncbi:MAG: NAD(+)/NADH kinase [Anaerolineales bacterium]|nr:NAD(+)/NADH kinase [Anaerolineales bacterium]
MTLQTVSVGIIANPASGSDIRRLVALGSVYGTQEKINIIQRTLVGLAAIGIDQIYLMPDVYRIGEAALEKLPQNLTDFRHKIKVLDMQAENCGEDSTNAARQMRVAGVGCIIVLGGDGTSRVVAKGCGDAPILPISTGTNNVIPYAVEGTVAGLAAGFVAHFPERISEFTYRSKWLEIRVQDGESDMALADVAVVDGQAVGSRAVWESEGLQQAILTRAEPKTTGISSLGGFIHPVSPLEPWGVHIQFGKPVVSRVTAPLAPGLMATFGVESVSKLSIGDVVTIQGKQCILALDGEREIPLRRDQSAQICLRQDGPWIVDVFKTLEIVAAQKVLVS